jgi:hypothetical protein
MKTLKQRQYKISKSRLDKFISFIKSSATEQDYLQDDFKNHILYFTYQNRRIRLQAPNTYVSGEKIRVVIEDSKLNHREVL